MEVLLLWLVIACFVAITALLLYKTVSRAFAYCLLCLFAAWTWSPFLRVDATGLGTIISAQPQPSGPSLDYVWTRGVLDDHLWLKINSGGFSYANPYYELTCHMCSTDNYSRDAWLFRRAEREYIFIRECEDRIIVDMDRKRFESKFIYETTGLEYVGKFDETTKRFLPPSEAPIVRDPAAPCG